ncbi:MAG: precorrin-6y C5,15-methyltransferase (decarboxylating), CbiE subunit,precorrin-6Y [Eubacterium sp.]|jgi:precorrin-6Y C5,15-methyltransferase (decarboxylating)|nr:precorrin-6y C5,15-methyltransferase (decarboxylating), CbiE subunit,precorrin-6Y [Eubacterium sp.]
MNKNLYIIGAGTGSEDYLTQKAIKLIKVCDTVFSTTKRLSALFAPLRGDISEYPVDKISEIIEMSQAKNIALLVSGDTGFFSITGTVIQRLPVGINVEIVSGISCLTYFCSKIGCSYENIKVISLHGRENSLLGAISYNPAVFVLTGGSNKAHIVCKNLMDNDMGEIKAIAGENLSMPQERIVEGTVKELSQNIFEDLTVLFFKNPDFLNYYLPLCDSDFVRGKVPMTKEEVRAVTLAKLAVEPEDIVYDIGAGTGSVAISMARRAFDGCVYAVEQKGEAVELIKENRKRLGAGNVVAVHGSAPQVLAGLPRPDKAFIGGTSGNMTEIVRVLLERNPRIRLAANAVTLESLSEAVNSFENHGLETEVTCINASYSRKVGGYHMMTANNPVYIILGTVK